jgi:phosphoribosylaminoimidazole carboxylase (NCAIR synthetase)
LCLQSRSIPKNFLKAFLRAADSIADERAIAENELGAITAVAAARKYRQGASQKQIQRGGILTAAKARAAVDPRVEEEAQKVARKATHEYKRRL